MQILSFDPQSISFQYLGLDLGAYTLTSSQVILMQVVLNTEGGSHVSIIHINVIHMNKNNLARASYYYLIFLRTCLTGHLKEVNGSYLCSYRERLTSAFPHILRQGGPILTSFRQCVFPAWLTCSGFDNGVSNNFQKYYSLFSDTHNGMLSPSIYKLFTGFNLKTPSKDYIFFPQKKGKENNSNFHNVTSSKGFSVLKQCKVLIKPYFIEKM